MSKPQVASVKCPKCAAPGTYIRTRPFRDGSGVVFMCNNPQCKSHGLYFYAPANTHTDPQPGGKK